jgi:hypothetical protein
LVFRGVKFAPSGTHKKRNRPSFKARLLLGVEMREHAIAAIPADGIGPEVIAAGLEVLQALTQKAGGFQLKVETFPWGSDYYKKHSAMMPHNGL